MLPPGPRHFPRLQSLAYLARPDAFMRHVHRRYGDVIRLKSIAFGEEVLVVRPEAIKVVFTSDSDALRAGEANVAIEPLVGRRSVLRLDGAEHLRHRRLMLPPFHGARMLEYAETMRSATERAMRRWPTDRPFALLPQMQDITLEVILRAIFGLTEEPRLAELGGAIRTLLERSSTPLALIKTHPLLRRELGGLSPWSKFLRLRGRVDRLIFRLIAERRTDQAPRSDILSLLLQAKDENGIGLTDTEVRDELATLLVAGHETTATELCWAFDKILREPRVLERVVAESEGASSVRALADCRYLDATIKEVLRLAPVIPAIGRRVKSPISIGGYDVPVGAMLVPAIWLTHRLPDIYPRPESFEPERFLDQKPDPYAWLPFGGGIRRCIGMAFALQEMKIILGTVLAERQLRLVRPEPPRITLRSFTHAPKGGVEVVATARATAQARPASDRSPLAAPSW